MEPGRVGTRRGPSDDGDDRIASCIATLTDHERTESRDGRMR